MDLIAKLESPDYDFESFLDNYLKKPWKFYSFTQLLEYEAFILKLREEIYAQCLAIKLHSMQNQLGLRLLSEKKLLTLLKGLRVTLEQSNFLDLKINYDFLLNPPSKYPDSSILFPLLFSDSPRLTFELLLTLNSLSVVGENLKTLPPSDRAILSHQLTAYLTAIDWTSKTPLKDLIEGRRTEEDKQKLAALAEKLSLELEDFNEPGVSCFLMMKRKGEINDDLPYSLDQLCLLTKFRAMRFFADGEFRLFFALQLLLAAELALSGVKLSNSELIDRFTQAFKEEKRSLLSHTLDQMTRIFRYNTPDSPDLSAFIFEVLQLSGFSYDQLLSEARNPARLSTSLENRQYSEVLLVRKWLELWPRKTPFFQNKHNIVGFLKLADKLRFSYENLEAQTKGVDVRGLLNFSEEEKRLLDKLIETIALEVLAPARHLENIEFLVPIIIYFKTVYNQEESPLFSLLYTILQDLITKSLENSAEIVSTRARFGFNLIEESILQLLQLFFVFEVRNEATEKFNKQLLNKEFFIRLEEALGRPEYSPVSHFIFNQVLFHSLTNDNNIIRDYLIETLEQEGSFQRFLHIFQEFFEENKVVFLCNFNLLRKKVLRICEEANNKLEVLSVDPRNMKLSRLYSQIFTSCFLLWADTSSLDNDFLEITCLRSLYEESLILIMKKLREIVSQDEIHLISLLSHPQKPSFHSYFLVYCDSLQKKYKLLLENLLYYLRAAAVKLYENDIPSELYQEFLVTFTALSHPLVLTLSKDYHLSKIHSLFESNFTLNHDKHRLLNMTLEFLCQVLRETEDYQVDHLISLNETPIKYYEKVLNKSVKELQGLRQAKRLELALILSVGLIRKPLFAETQMNYESLNSLFEGVQKAVTLFKMVKPGFFNVMEQDMEEFCEESMELEHFCSVHPQNDFSRKLLHKCGLLRQLAKFLFAVLKIKTRGVLGSELKKIQDYVSNSLLRCNVAEIIDYSDLDPMNRASVLKIVFLFDEIRRTTAFVHESKLPSCFLVDEVLLKFAMLIQKLQAHNTEYHVRHESLLPGLDLVSRVNFYFFCRILLNFLPEFLIKSLLFNEFSFILENDFTGFLGIVCEKILKVAFIYWKGFFKSSEEIPLKLIKLVETLNSKVLPSKTLTVGLKPRNRSRLLQLNHAILKLFLESTYQINLRVRSIYFYKLLHIICLLNDNKEMPFSQIKAPYLAYFIRLLESHFQAISPKWNIENTSVMHTIMRSVTHYQPRTIKSIKRTISYKEKDEELKENDFANDILNENAVIDIENNSNLKENDPNNKIQGEDSLPNSDRTTKKNHDQIYTVKEKALLPLSPLRLKEKELIFLDKAPYLDPSLDSHIDTALKSPVFSKNLILFEKTHFLSFEARTSLSLFDPLELIPQMGTIESACVQAMLTNLISRLLFSERQWDSDPALQPGLREMYWNWEATKDFAKYVSLLLQKLTEERASLSEEELDTLHNDTIGNLIEMLKENLPEITSNSSTKGPHLDEFLDVCFDFIEKYFQQQRIQMSSPEKLTTVNVIRQEMLRDLIGIIGSGLLSPPHSRQQEKMRKRTFDVLFIGLKDLTMFRETGFHEKFSQELLRLLEILVIEPDDTLRNSSIEFLIKSAFYDGKSWSFKSKIHYKELLKENIEKSFNSNGRFFVNNLYKLCTISEEKDNKPSEKHIERPDSSKEPKEDVFLTFRKGIIPDEIQGVEEPFVSTQVFSRFMGLFLEQAFGLVLESLEKKIEEKPHILDLDLSVKLMVLMLGKYPTLMPASLKYQLKLGEYTSKLTDLQKERLFFVKKILGTSQILQQKNPSAEVEISVNFLEMCYVFYDQKPHIFRQFLLLFCNQDFSYLRISEKTIVSSGKIIRKGLIDLFHAELTRFIGRLVTNSPKTTRLLENSDEVLTLRNLINLSYKVLLNKGHLNEESQSFLKEKLLEFLEILLEVLRKVSHPLDLIVLRDINYFGYLANVYKQVIKLSFFLKTGLQYSKSNEYLKFYMNKHLKGFFSKGHDHPNRFNKNQSFHNLIFSGPIDSNSEHNPWNMSFGNPDMLQRLFAERNSNSRKCEWLLMKEREIHDYSKNISVYNQQSMNHAKLFLESREDLRRLAPNNPDLNIYENLKNMIKAGLLRETEQLSLSRENYDQNSMKYIVWPTSPSLWLEKMQDFHSKSSNNKKIFLTFEQMVFELRSLTQEIRTAMKNEALKYALEAEDSEPLGHELQTQSCLTIFGCEDAVLDQYYQNTTSEISTFHERRFNSEQKMECYESEEEEEIEGENDEAPPVKKKNKSCCVSEDIEKAEVFSAKGPLFGENQNPEDVDSEKNFQKSYLRGSQFSLTQNSVERSEGKEDEGSGGEEDEGITEVDEEMREEDDEEMEEEEEEEREKSRISTEMDEESKYMPEENNNTPTFLDRYGIDHGYFSLIPEEMREEVLEGARELYEDSRFERTLHHNTNVGNGEDTMKLENLKKFKLLLLRESELVEKGAVFNSLNSRQSDYRTEVKEIEKTLDTMSYSLKKKVFLQADKTFLMSFSEKVRREAEEILREVRREDVQSFEENESSKEEETIDNYDNEGSEDEEEEKGQANQSVSNNNPNECRSLKFIDEDAEPNLSNLAESSNNSESKYTEKAFTTDEFKLPQSSLMKKLALDKSDKFESDGGRRVRNKTKRGRVLNKKNGLRERFLFKNYKKVKEIDEKLNKIDFFHELPEIEDDLLEKLFEMFHYSLVLTENSSQLALKSLFKLFKTLLFNPYNAYKLIDGLVFMLFHYLGVPNDEESGGIFPLVGYGLLESYPTVSKKEIIQSGVLNNLFSMVNKLVENHYCLPLFLQSKIDRDRPLFFKEMTKPRDFSLSFVRNMRKTSCFERTRELPSPKDQFFYLMQKGGKQELFMRPLEKCESFSGNGEALEKQDYILEKRGSLPENGVEVCGSESMSLLNLLISYLSLYEGNGFLSYLNGDILLTLIKSLLKLSVVNDGFLAQKTVKYPKYKIEAPLYDSQDINSLCQIFYQKRIRLKYFDSSYYELFVEYSKSPLNFERFFLALLTNYTVKFTEDMQMIKTKAMEFSIGLKEKSPEARLKSFWENVLLTHSHNSLAEDFHIFRHIVKDLVVLFETPLKIFYEETVYKEFLKKFGISVKDLEKEDCDPPHENLEKGYLREWLALQKMKRKEAFLGHLREKLLRSHCILRFFELVVEVLRLMVSVFGVDFTENGQYENERLEDCYYFFIYPVKSLLILYSFLSFSQEEGFTNDFIGISGIKTREILKSEKEFGEREAFSDQYENSSPGFKSQGGSDNYSLRTIAQNNRLERIFEAFLTPDFLKLITFFMQSKAEPDKLGNYLDYIRRAKKKSSLSLEIKLGYLRSFSKIKAIGGKPHNSRFLDEPLTLYISRSSIWNSTLETLLTVSNEEMALRPLKIVFEGEEGIDYGGITREWLSLLNKEVFDPNFGLFKLSANMVSYQPNPLSCVIPDHLTHFRELGRLVGKVILDNLNIEVNFVQSFLKHIIGETLYIRDLSSIDPDLCKNLEWILENDVKDLDLTFAYDLDYFDLPVTIELVEDGQNLRVNELNKKEYVKQMCYAKMACEIKAQTEAFLTGFLALIPREALSLIDDKELGMKLCGTSEIDRIFYLFSLINYFFLVEDMKQNTELLAYSKESQVILWLWEILKEFDQETLAKFLFFVTGSFKVPYGGFKNFKIKIERLYNGNALPTAHTCFNQLDLPEYESKEKMKDKILVAILEGNKGFYIC